MRSELGKECRKLFRKMMSSQFPEYREDKGQTGPQGRYVWTRQHPSGIWFHVLLLIHHSRDQFTIEAAWDLDSKLPAPAYGELGGILEQPFLFRPNWLWSGKDYWWLLVLRPEEYERSRFYYEEDPIERCLQLVAPAVWDASEKLKDHVVPLFEKIAQKRGDGKQVTGATN
jgi:hypothetical protein